ncbi:MAG: hypothetical protein NTW62_00295 [Candidatus Nomurabacteria bacterium]|nr:hypothetical protein [Candidatus Nomurabacteria bacterium]
MIKEKEKISNGMKVVTVIPLIKGIFSEDLTYFTAKPVPDGSIVTIPFRKKEILGIAVSSEEVSSSKSDIKNMTFNLRKITDVKEHSIFSNKFLESGIEISRYFSSTKGSTLLSLLPASFREEYDAIAKCKNTTPSAFSHSPLSRGEKNSIKPEKLLFQSPTEERLGFYKTLVRESFAEKKSIFIVLPTESDINNFKEKLSHGIEQFTFNVHGGLTAKKQIDQFKKIINTEHPVLIFGTAQFLSIPRNDIGTIIIEHESSNSYKMFNRPFLDLRVFVELFAEKIGAKLILADDLLRFETINRREGLSEIRPLSFRLNFEGEIKIENQNEDKDKKFKIFSDINIEEIKESIKNKKNVFVFSLRKGLATMTVCRDCSTPIMCDKCLAPIILYLSADGKKRMFICNRCGTEKDPLMTCPHCESWNLTPLGIGTDTVYEELKKHIPETKIFKIDKESAKTKKGAEKIIADFEDKNKNEQGAVLIGTEMAFFYMKEKVELSVISSFDSLWAIPNFKMSEKIIHIIFSLINITKNKIIIQTKNEKDGALISIKNDNLLNFVREELQDRKNLEYPPFKRFIKVTYTGNKEQTIVNKKYLAELFKDYDVRIFSAFVSKVKGLYVTNALIKLDLNKWSLNEINKDSTIDPKLSQKLSSLSMDFYINVDPEDLL